MSAEQYQKLEYAAGMSGVSMGTLEKAAKNLQETGSELTLEQAIAQVAAIEDADERAAAACDLFGSKAAYEMVPLLNAGADGIQGMYNEAEQLGIIMSNDAVAAGAAFGDSMSRFNQTLTGVKNNIVAEFLPSLSGIMDGLTELVAGTDGAKEKFSEGVSGFVSALNETLPQVLEAASLIITSLLGAITDSLPQLFASGTSILLELVNGIISLLPSIITAGMDCLTALLQGITDALPEMVPTMVSVITEMITNLTAQLPTIVGMGIQLLTSLIEGIVEALPTLVAAMPEIITNIISTLTENIPLIIQCGIDLLTSLITNLPEIIAAIVAAIP